MEKDLLVSKEAAEAANRAKTEFLANISHDMKTPLAGIVTTAEVIAGDEHSSERDRQYASIISDSGKQLAKFFTSCLDLSKLEMQEWSSKNETFSIQTLLQNIQALFAPQALAKNLLFTVESDHTLPKSVEGHRDSLYRILLNLTGNALKFTEQGKITLRALRVSAPDDQHVKVAFQVQDTGVGIPEDKYHVIFEKFRRLEPSYKNNIEGSGVGLYIVDQFIKRMNGAIDVKSKVGDGSVFTATVILKIPASDVLSLSEKSSTFSLKHKHADELPHVLLVEDTEMIQFITKSLLIDAGFSVDVANSGEEALEKFLPEKYDLIYMDIGLPGMDGYQMTRAIRAQEKKYQAAHNIPIIALTGHGAIDVQEFCGEAGMQGVLSKPLTREQAEKVWQRFGENESIIVPGLTDLVAQQATTEENAILDISATIKIVGIKDIAEKMVTDFIKDLQGNFLPEIKTLILQRKDEELRFLLHRQLGSLAYVKAPQLHQRLLTLQKAAHDGGAYSEKDYEEIEQEVLRVVDCCQRMSK